MLFKLLNLFAIYLLVAMILSTMLKIFPQFIRDAFSVFDTFKRRGTQFVVSIYRTESNLEVNLLAVFFFPFVLLILLYMSIQTFIFSFPQYIAINIFLYIATGFVIASIVPTTQDLDIFNNLEASSILIFVFKIFLIIQLFVDIGSHPRFNYYIILLLITPISPYLPGLTKTGNYDVKPAKKLTY